jgi:hypothetical protein
MRLSLAAGALALLNCEGSFKENEGPARCISQYEAFDTCLEADAT